MKSFAGHFKTIGLVALAGVSLSACAYDDYGYGGVSVGYGGGGYYDDYYPGYGGYPGYGWYDGFYYPGSGYYVYDRGGHRHRWSDKHRRYWEGRREHAGRPGDGRPGGWNGRPDRPDRPGNGWAGRPDRPGDGAGRPDRPDRPDRPGGGWAGRPDRPGNGAGRPDRGDREEWRQRRDAARGEGVWGAVPRENRPQVNPRPNANQRPATAPQRSVAPRPNSAPRATPPGGRSGQAIRDGRGGPGRESNNRPH